MAEVHSRSCALAAGETKEEMCTILISFGGYKLWFMNWSFPKPRKGVELQSIKEVINVPHRNTWSK